MRQIRSFGDERAIAGCVYCGGAPETREHVPSRVLLDEPFPENLPLVGACSKCNAGFSIDEEYLACLIDCTLAGSASPEAVERTKVRRILTERPALAAKIASSRTESDGVIRFLPETKRVRRVLLKLARGHALFELHEQHPGPPSYMEFGPLVTWSPEKRQAFEQPPETSVWPEVGSRAMQRVAEGDSGWLEVQKGRYRYLAAADGAATVRIVLSEYLGCEVIWED